MLSKANEQPTPSSPSIASSSNPLARALKAPVADVERNALANPLHLHYWGRTDPSYDLDSLGRQWLALRNRSLSTGSLSAALKCLHSGDAKPKSAIGAKRKAKATGKSPRQSLSQSAGELGASETERVFDACERSCAEWLLSRARAAGCLGIEFDESTVCDVCKSPISEECNEIIFCDGCNLCVHQACYGVSEIPSDVWYCSPCQQRVPRHSTDESPSGSGSGSGSGSKEGSRSPSPSPKSRSAARATDSITLFPVPNFSSDHKQHQRQQSRPSEPATEDAPCCILCGFAGGALKQLDASFNDALKRKWRAASIAVASLDAHKRSLVNAGPGGSGAASSLSGTGAAVVSAPESSRHNTKNQTFWSHVACVLWLPECRFGDPSKMEPVLQVEDIPPWRFKLTCVVCERSVGACISCCVSGCRAVFHVSCASRQHYLMRTVLLARSDDVKLMAYCEKHSKWRRELHQLQERAAVSMRPQLPDSSSSKRNSNNRRLKAVECRIDDGVEIFEFDGNEAQYNKLFLEEDSRPDLFPTTSDDEKPLSLPFFCCTNGLQLSSSLPTSTQNLEAKLRTLSLDFHQCLPLPGAETIAKQLHVADTDLNAISSFWALKRRALSPESAPLLPYPPLSVAVRMAGSALGGVGSSAAARRMSRLAFRLLYLVHLRRHIERVRNMCYLLVRRERMRKRFLCLKRSVLDAQLKFSREHLPPASKGGAPVKQLTPPSSPVDGFKKPFSPAALKRLNSFQSLGLHMRSPSISDLESLSSAHLIAASSSGSTVYENWAAFREGLATYRSLISSKSSDGKLDLDCAPADIDSCISSHLSLAAASLSEESADGASELTPEPSASSCSSATSAVRRVSSSSESIAPTTSVPTPVQTRRQKLSQTSKQQQQQLLPKSSKQRKRKASKHDENRPLQHSPLPTPPRSRASSTVSSTSTSEATTVSLSDSGVTESVREQRERPATSARKQQQHGSQPSISRQNKSFTPKRAKKSINSLPPAKKAKAASNSYNERSKAVASLQREELAFMRKKRAELLKKVSKHLRLRTSPQPAKRASAPAARKKQTPDDKEKVTTTSSGKWTRVLRSRRILRNKR